MNCTPFVRQYDIPNDRWSVFNKGHRPVIQQVNEMRSLLGFQRRCNSRCIKKSKAKRLAACSSQTTSPFDCLNSFYFKILSNFFWAIQTLQISQLRFLVYRYLFAYKLIHHYSRRDRRVEAFRFSEYRYAIQHVRQSRRFVCQAP